MAELAAIALNATSYVLILILVALGLVVVFGMMGVINMAHGELFMLGAYVVVAAQGAGAPFWLAVLAAPLVVGALGAVIVIVGILTPRLGVLAGFDVGPGRVIGWRSVGQGDFRPCFAGHCLYVFRGLYRP